MDKKLLNILNEFKDEKWDSVKDSRILFFKYITELNSNTILQFAFQAESYHLTKNKDWLKKILPHLANNIDKISNMDNYSSNRNNNISSQIWDTFILNYFNEFETRLRSIVRNLGNVRNLEKTKRKSSLNGNEGFYLVYRGLFEHHLNFNKTDYEVLKIFAAIRNTIHNSGIYFTPNKKNYSFNYRGEIYHFIYGKPVNFITSNFVKNMLFDLLDLWRELIKDKRIGNIGLIKDPIAEVKFE
ncbi:MAG: hypothetical protein ACOCQ4_02065 [bacterium]